MKHPLFPGLSGHCQEISIDTNGSVCTADLPRQDSAALRAPLMRRDQARRGSSGPSMAGSQRRDALGALAVTSQSRLASVSGRPDFMIESQMSLSTFRQGLSPAMAAREAPCLLAILSRALLITRYVFCNARQQATADDGVQCEQGPAASRSGAGLCGGLQQQGLHLLQVPPARPLGP